MKKLIFLPLVCSTLLASARKIFLPVGTKNKQIYITNVATALNPKPGDSLVIPEGREIISLLLSNFRGTALKPIYIIQEHRNTVIGGYSSYAFNISEAQYVIMDGIHVNGRGKSAYGISIGMRCSNIVLQNFVLENFGSGFGVQIKWNPILADASTAFPNQIRNIVIRNGLIRKTGSEGIYAGHTGSPAPPKGMQAARINGLLIENITIDSCGWDGVQLSGTKNVRMKNITVTNFGTKARRGQQSGICIQADAANVSLDGFKCEKGTGPGLTILARNKIVCKNGIIKNVASSSTEHGIYVDDFPSVYEEPPLHLTLQNIDIDGATNSPVFIKNSRSTQLPGLLENITYRKVKGKIIDHSKSSIVSQKR